MTDGRRSRKTADLNDAARATALAALRSSRAAKPGGKRGTKAPTETSTKTGTRTSRTDAKPPSLRDRLAAFFRAGRNGTDHELAAMFEAPVGSISVYRCQLKKLGLATASPRARRRGAIEPPNHRAGLVELNRVLVRNAETELAFIAARNPELAGPIATVQRTLALLVKLHRLSATK